MTSSEPVANQIVSPRPIAVLRADTHVRHGRAHPVAVEDRGDDAAVEDDAGDPPCARPSDGTSRSRPRDRSADHLLLRPRPAGLSAPQPQQWLNGIRSWNASRVAPALLPLDRARGLGSDVVRHAVHPGTSRTMRLRDPVQHARAAGAPSRRSSRPRCHDPDDDGVARRCRPSPITPTALHVGRAARRTPARSPVRGRPAGSRRARCASAPRTLRHALGASPRRRSARPVPAGERLALHDLLGQAQLGADLRGPRP